MILNTSKERLYTSIFLFALVFLVYKINFLFVYTLIICGVLSAIEFLGLTKKIFRNKLYLFFSNFFFLIYLSFFCFIFLIFYNHNPLKFLIFSLLLSCVSSDIGGFIFGKIFKGPKLSKISPNKTISGAIGSIFLSCVVLFSLFYILSIDLSIYILFLASITSVACQIGDLFFSFLKRKAKVKDTGNFLPGHGGILDRLDGILLGIPVGVLFMGYLQ